MSTIEDASYPQIIIKLVLVLSMEGDAILSVHAGDTRKVAELRWDGASKII